MYLTELHKIHGVEKCVCTCEQMLAYNFALNDYRLNASAERIAEMAERSLQSQVYSKYNIAAVVRLIRDNLDKYRALEYHILTSYQEIGKAFPLS